MTAAERKLLMTLARVIQSQTHKPEVGIAISEALEVPLPEAEITMPRNGDPRLQGGVEAFNGLVSLVAGQHKTAAASDDVREAASKEPTPDPEPPAQDEAPKTKRFSGILRNR